MTYTASVVFALMVADLLKFVLSMIFTYSAVYAEMTSWQYIYFLKMRCTLTIFNKSKQDKSFHLDVEFVCLIVILTS